MNIFRHALPTTAVFLGLFLQAAAQTTESGYLAIGKDSLYYETAGKGPVIVFIHDGILPLPLWDDQVAFFSKNYRIVRYDRRGYGKSTAAHEAYTNEGDLNLLFKHLHIDTACLVGASAGGWLSLNFTLQHPEKVTSLVLVGAVVYGVPFTPHFFIRGGHIPDSVKTLDAILRYCMYDDPYEMYVENKAAREKAQKIFEANPRKPGINTRDEIPSTIPPLQKIKVPVLILVGEFDIPDVHAHAGAINALIAGSKRTIIPRSGHLIPLEQPELFNTAMKNFLEPVE